MRASNRLLTDVDRNWATSRGEEEKRAPWQGYNKRSGSGWYTWTPPEKTSIDQIRSLSRPQQLTISRLHYAGGVRTGFAEAVRSVKGCPRNRGKSTYHVSS
jgi:hypothetical protein